VSAGSGAAAVGPRRVPVRLAQPYEVLIGSGLLAEVAPSVSENEVAVITDANVGPLHAAKLAASLSASGKRVEVFTVPPGEASKDAAVWLDLTRSLARAGFSRGAAVLALGGGVVGDLAGFVAASYLRGVALYQLPTSLLAMVDSSVGGKTGLDLPEGKNLLGAIWQPRAVFADVSVLATLPVREFRQGTVELVKHGYLADPELIELFEGGWGPEVGGAALAEAVARSVAVKAAVVAADERETAGARATLNLGHTLGHALEAATGHALTHGDAVGYGLVYAALLGRRRGFEDLLPGFLRLLTWLAPGALPDLGFEDLSPFLQRDKKRSAGAVRFVLLERIGKPVVVGDVSRQEQESAWRELREVVG